MGFWTRRRCPPCAASCMGDALAQPARSISPVFPSAPGAARSARALSQDDLGIKNKFSAIYPQYRSAPGALSQARCQQAVQNQRARCRNLFITLPKCGMRGPRRSAAGGGLFRLCKTPAAYRLPLCITAFQRKPTDALRLVISLGYSGRAARHLRYLSRITAPVTEFSTFAQALLMLLLYISRQRYAYLYSNAARAVNPTRFPAHGRERAAIVNAAPQAGSA